MTISPIAADTMHIDGYIAEARPDGMTQEEASLWGERSNPEALTRWEDQLRVFRNWTEGKARVTQHEISDMYNRWGPFPFVLADDGRALELNRVLRRDTSPFLVRDLANGIIAQKVPLGQRPCASDFCGSVWSAFTEEGRIVRFDLASGQCVGQIESNPLHFLPSQWTQVTIHSNGREIAVWKRTPADQSGGVAAAWSTSSGALTHDIQTKEKEEVLSLRTTTNFFVYQTKAGAVRFIDKFDPTASAQQIESSCLPFDGFGPYIVCPNFDGRIKVFEDGIGFLTPIFELSTFPEPRIKIYKYWLCIEEKDAFAIWNLRTRNLVARVKKLPGMPQRCLDFNLNAAALFVRESLVRGVRYDFNHE